MSALVVSALPLLTLWPSKEEKQGKRVSYPSWDSFFASPFFEAPGEVPRKEKLRGWAPVAFRGNLRDGDHVASCSAVAVDYELSQAKREKHEAANPDAEPLFAAELPDIFELWRSAFGLVHSTHSHRGLDGARYRVILPLTRYVDGDEYRAICKALQRRAESFGHHVDRGASDPSRLWFVPAVRPGKRGEYERLSLDGEPIDPDQELAALEAEAARKRIAYVAPTIASAPETGEHRWGPYVLAALAGATSAILAARPGERNDLLAQQAWSLGGLVHLGALSGERMRRELGAACQAAGWPEPWRSDGTIRRQLAAGAGKPRTPEDRPLRASPTAPAALPPQRDASGEITSNAPLASEPPAPVSEPPAPRKPSLEVNTAAPGEVVYPRSKPLEWRESKPSKEDGELNKGQKVLEILKTLDFVKNRDGRVFLRHEGAGLSTEDDGYTDVIAGLYYEVEGDVIGKGDVENATRVVQAKIKEETTVGVRVSGSRECLALDLGYGAPWVVTPTKIGPWGGGVVPTFARASGTGRMPVPIMPTSDEESARVFGKLRQVLAIENDLAWACCLAWLVAALRPVGPYPILVVRGEEGSGKTTLSRALREIVDPRCPDLPPLPDGQDAKRNLAIMTDGAHVLAFENVSTITTDMSDALSRLATGDGFQVRKLFKGRGLETFTACRPILFNGISDAATRADLLSRCLLLPRLPKRTIRRDDDLITADLERLRPRVLGALLWCTARAMQGAGRVEVSQDIRMFAAARWATAAEEALGLPAGAVEAAYLESRAEARDMDAEDPLSIALFSWWDIALGKSQTEWTGTTDQLLELLTKATFDGKKAPDSWPQQAVGLSKRLDRLTGSLRAQGLEFRREKPSNGRRMLVLRRFDPSKEVPAAT